MSGRVLHIIIMLIFPTYLHPAQPVSVSMPPRETSSDDVVTHYY